eukprot:GHVS01031998.1.p1 GENE.GHVS01031998.1~~GHVS01031998.1.p1  ORF type:complete len:426 (-),score=43.22 GHVS01031998.1:503-1780(-)
MASPPSFHLPFRTIAKKHRKTLFHLLLAVGALHLLPVSWQVVYGAITKNTPSMVPRTLAIEADGGDAKRRKADTTSDYVSGSTFATCSGSTSATCSRSTSNTDSEPPSTMEVSNELPKVVDQSCSNKPQNPFVDIHWLAPYTATRPKPVLSGRLHCQSDNKRVTIDGEIGSEDKNKKEVGQLEAIPSSGLLLTDYTIDCKPASASLAPAGCWLEIAKKENAARMTMVILFGSDTVKDEVEGYRVVGKPKFLPPITPDSMWVPSLPAVNVLFENLTEPLSLIIYFTPYISGDKVVKESVIHLTSDTFNGQLCTMTLQMPEQQLMDALVTEERILHLKGNICGNDRSILLHSQCGYDEIFCAPTGSSGSGAGSIGITVQIEQRSVADEEKNLVYRSKASYTVDDSQSTVHRKRLEELDLTFEVYELR